MNRLKQFTLKLVVVASFGTSAAMADSKSSDELKSGKYSITQSWSQEKDYPRPYWVQVPAHDGELPVLIFLHGNGGNALGAKNGFLRRHPEIAERFITVFAEGYEKSWNIVSERSKADDRGFVEAIVMELARHGKVDADHFTIMGSSNGAALANQIAIETQLPNIRNYITTVSPLNTFQHDGENFKAKGEDNNYSEPVNPRTGIRLLNVSGTTDQLVPYAGGPSRAIPAKGGKLPFVAAEESIFLWAKQLGHDGQKLTGPSQVEDPVEVFSYLDGNVVHLKVNGRGHNASGALSEERLLSFLSHQADPAVSRLVANLGSGRAQTVVTYGTSLTAGAAWVKHLQAALEQSYPGKAEVINGASGGKWSTWGVENLEKRVIEKKPDTVLIEFGINDAFLPYDTSVEKARSNLETMIDRILESNAECEIILMIMNPPIGVHLERRPGIRDYYQMYRDVAGERELMLIDHEPAWTKILEEDKRLFDEYLPDGIHPGAKGCEMVITPSVLEALGLQPKQGAN